MKTTLEIPADLHQEAKALAALENCELKDLVAEELRLAIRARRSGTKRPTPQEVLQEIRRHPLHSSKEITRIMEEARAMRKEGWNREDRNS